VGAEQTGNQRTARVDAEDFLWEALAEGTRHSKDVMLEAEEAGIRPRTLNRARKSIARIIRNESNWSTLCRSSF